MNESVDDMLDLFPDDGELFSANESDKTATPNEKGPLKSEELYPVHISPIAFEKSQETFDTLSEAIRIPLVNPKLCEGIKRTVTSRLGTAKQNRWNNPPYPMREIPNQNFISHPTQDNFTVPVMNRYPHRHTPQYPFPNNTHILPTRQHSPDFSYNNRFQSPGPAEILYGPKFPRSPLYNTPNFNDNPSHFRPDTLSINFEQLNSSIQEGNLLHAWINFYEVSPNCVPVPIGILLDFISLVCKPDAFSNWPDNYQSPHECIFILVSYLNRNNFNDNEIYDNIMLAFSRLPQNEGLFRCLELLRTRCYKPTRNTLLSIMKCYKECEISYRLLELFPILSKNNYLDPEMLNAFLYSIQSLFFSKREQVIDILLRISSDNTPLSLESYILLIECSLNANEITFTLQVISYFPPKTQLENKHIESIILKSPAHMISKIFKFVEQLNDSQRSMLSQSCYSTLIDKSITSNYPYGISYLFGLFINFNKLIETSLMVKLLEFIFRNKHTLQATKIFQMMESFRTSGELNSLTNIFIPPTMHKISQILIEHESYTNLYTFVMAMLKEKIVPLKPVLKSLVEHLKAVKDNEKVTEIYNFAVENELVFDAEIFNEQKETQQFDEHFILQIDTPIVNTSEFNFPKKTTNKSNKIEILISAIDSMVCNEIPQEHVFNHILVSMGQNIDILSSFKILLETFIPGDPDRSVEHKNKNHILLIRTAMRLTTNFAFIKDWKSSIKFLELLNKSRLLKFQIPPNYSKELFQFLYSSIEASLKENNLIELFKIFEKINWPSFTLFEQSDLFLYKTQLLSLFTHCLEQLSLKNAYLIITYILQDKGDETSRECFSKLLRVTSTMDQTSIALMLFTFMNTNKIDISIEHRTYQQLITHLGQENKLQQAKMVFQHALDNSCYTAMLNVTASPNQINLYSNLIPIEIKFLLEKRLQSLYNMNKDFLTDVHNIVSIQPFEISFLRNMLTTNRTAYQESIRSFLLIVSEEFTPPLIENPSNCLKDINFLKIYKITIPPGLLRQYLLENFVADKDKPSPNTSIESLNLFIPNEKDNSNSSTCKSQFISPDIEIKQEVSEDSYNASPQIHSSTQLSSSSWFCEVKRSINSKLSKYYWTGPIPSKEDYNLIAKRVTKLFRESISNPELEVNGILTSCHNDKIDALIKGEISKFTK
ncbi:hypothetical protein LOD99_4403 [Oopsacas minuta]|uniref:Uncharacterized protein n=1 Tax=Oopsacas minuta TaxID=111878 RepID=A0AAV7JUD9_9METZ|nr:hypothetical protein LOD99_4403 [Oopsacas minuta]